MTIRVLLEIRTDQGGRSHWMYFKDDMLDEPAHRGAGFTVEVNDQTIEVSVKHVPDDMKPFQRLGPAH